MWIVKWSVNKIYRFPLRSVFQFVFVCFFYAKGTGIEKYVFNVNLVLAGGL